MKSTGTPTFRAAFLDLHHDTLMQTNLDQAKEAAAKELQAQRKKGILGIKPYEVLTISATKDDGYCCEIELKNGEIYYSLEDPEEVIEKYNNL